MEAKTTERSRSGAELARVLRRIDGAGYGRYRSLSGTWEFGRHTLEVERVQPDPFAPPSRVSLRVPAEVASLPRELWATRIRRVALADYLIRVVARDLSGTALRIDVGGQEVIERSACQIRDGAVIVRIGVELPGHGRRIDGTEAERLFWRVLPRIVDECLHWAALDPGDARRFVACVEDTEALRGQLADHGLVAFVADGAVLPRSSGVDDRPLPEGAIPFESPPSLRVEVDLPSRGRVSGMGIPEGVTLVVGGGFHGKSTLLRALERAVYNHVPDDGRELVAARTDTVKIRAEDGRRVSRVDVSPFVGELPTGADTADFSTGNASGSTSQAASILEAVEAGAGVLLVDEDTAATNLMVRDARMRALVGGDKEPLTPFVDLVRPLYRDRGVSTVLVMGGSGDYFAAADHVVMMDAFRPREVSQRARELAATAGVSEAPGFPPVVHRVPDPASLRFRVGGRARVKGRGTEDLFFGESTIDLRAVEQLVDPSQVIGVGLALTRLVEAGYLDGKRTLAEALDGLGRDLADGGVETLRGRYAGDVALPRRLEVAAALNRLRTLRVTDRRRLPRFVQNPNR